LKIAKSFGARVEKPAVFVPVAGAPTHGTKLTEFPATPARWKLLMGVKFTKWRNPEIWSLRGQSMIAMCLGRGARWQVFIMN